MIEHEVKDLSLAELGHRKILWADIEMPVLRQIRTEFSLRKPFVGYRVALSLHVTPETTNLLRTLQAGGAELTICACNPLSTQDDAAAALVKHYGVPVFAIKGEDNNTYYRHLDRVLDSHPHLLIDDGADLISELHKQRPHQLPEVLGAAEQTSTGLTRINSMARLGILKFPVLAINNAQTKSLFDNRYGTGQSTIDGVIRATNTLFAGKNVVVCGYGWCGKGIALRAKGLGAVTTVVEVNPIRALEAAMDGFIVKPIAEASLYGDIFITATGDLNVIRREHFETMKDGAILCNAGHFNSEIDISALEELADGKVAEVRPYVHEYLVDTKRLFLIGEGRLINLATAEGHPAAVMDMSFAVQALALEYLVKHRKEFQNKVYPIPLEVDEQVAHLKLKAMGIPIDRLTSEQEEYRYAWEIGT